MCLGPLDHPSLLWFQDMACAGWKICQPNRPTVGEKNKMGQAGDTRRYEAISVWGGGGGGERKNGSMGRVGGGLQRCRLLSRTVPPPPHTQSRAESSLLVCLLPTVQSSVFPSLSTTNTLDTMGQAVSTADCRKHSVSIPGHGTLTGVTLKNPASGEETTHRFARIPYALKPQRFSLPTPIPDDYDYTGEYLDFGVKCPQPVVDSDILKYPDSPSDEYIQYANVWTPSSDKYKPKNGWPVLIYIHGGWLQYGDPNNDYFNLVEMMDDKHFHEKYVFVTIGYRLNIFGFLTCNALMEEDAKNTNMGFWDQREAIKWVKKYIGHFGGDADKITVSGLSAGAYSTFFQLAYEAYHPEEEQIIKQVIFFSNMIYSQPKGIDECNEQYAEIVEKLEMKDMSPVDQLKKLRSLDIKYMEKFIPQLKLHTFRAVSDGHFISKTVMSDIKSGVFAKKLVAKGVRIMHGEVDNEGYLYSLLNPPTTFEELAVQLENYYPKKVVNKILEIYDVQNKIDKASPDFKREIAELFGKIVADGQVYVSSRGFIKNLIQGGFPAKDYYRYRVSFRGKFLDEHLDPKIKVTHAYDKIIWFYTLRVGFNEKEVEDIKCFLQPYLKFLYFEDDIQEWETSDESKLRWFKEDGSVSYEEDPDWELSVKIADKIYAHAEK